MIQLIDVVNVDIFDCFGFVDMELKPKAHNNNHG